MLIRASLVKQQLSRTAFSAITALQQQPSAVGLHKVLAALDADIEATGAAGPAEAAQVCLWLDAGLIPALVDHAASCAPQHQNHMQPSSRRRAGDQQNAHRHAAAIASLIVRAGPARGAHQARLAIRCICTRLDAGGLPAAPPLLQLLLSLIDCAGLPDDAAAGDGEAAEIGFGQPLGQDRRQRQFRERHSPVPCQCQAIADAVVDSSLLLEVLQDLYARTAWHLPAAEMLAKLRGIHDSTPSRPGAGWLQSSRSLLFPSLTRPRCRRPPPPIYPPASVPAPAAVGLGASHMLGLSGDELEAAVVAGAAAAAAQSAAGAPGWRPPGASVVRSPGPSESGSPVRRPLVVPRLSLPVAGASTPGTTASRRSLATTDQRASVRASAASDHAGEPNALALQRLGYACGQSAMCADLAAFVAHKQAHCGGGSSTRRTDSAAAPLASAGAAEDGGSGAFPRGGGDASDDACAPEGPRRGPAGARDRRPDQWCRAPEPLRAKLLLLACLSRVAACYAAARRPPPVSPVNLLVSELLVPEEDMRSMCRNAARAKGDAGGGGGGAGGPRPPQPGEGGDAVAEGVGALRRLSMRVVARFGQVAGGGGGGATRGTGSGGGVGPSARDDTAPLDARPKQHDDVISQLRHRLVRLVGQDKDAMRDPGVLRACREPLLVLHHYLGAMASPNLADAVVCQVQEPLARLEHAVRAVQVRFLQPEALSALEALARVYSQLLRLDGRCASTHSWLMAQLGCSQAPQAAAAECGACASDTLQLLLDVLRTRPHSGATGGGSGSGSGTPAGGASSPGRPQRRSAAAGPGFGGAGAERLGPGGWPLSRLGSDAGAPAEQPGAAAAGAAVAPSAPAAKAGQQAPFAEGEARLRLWLWRFVTELLRFAVRHPYVKPLAPLSGGWFPPGPEATSRGSSFGGARHAGHGSLCAAGSSAGASRSSSFGAHGAGGGGSGQDLRRLLAAEGHGLSSPGGGGGGQRAGGPLRPGAACSSRGASPSEGGMPGSGPGHMVVLLLADELLRSKGGRPVAVQHLEDAAAGPGLLAVQLQVLEFMRDMSGAPNSPLLAEAQLSDFYIHHHFLQFARLYHAIPAAPREPPAQAPAAAAAAAAGKEPGAAGDGALLVCRAHLGVLLEMALRAAAGGGVRRRFLQLHVLDFLLRELSLEHGVRHQGPMTSRTVSSYSTPASTARPASTRVGGAGAGPGPGSASARGASNSEAAGATAPAEILSRVAEHAAAGQAESPKRATAGASSGGLPGVGPAVRSAPLQPPAAAPEPSAPSSPPRGGSPLRGRRLAPRPSSGGGAAGESGSQTRPAATRWSSPHRPQPPEGPKPPSVSPTRRPQAASRLSPERRPAAQLPPVQLPAHGAGVPWPLAADAPCGGAGAPADATCPGRPGSPPPPTEDGGSSCGGTPEPPQPTGDMSEDLAAIEEWEERTGRVYEFGGLSDAEDEAPGPGRAGSASLDRGASLGAESACGAEGGWRPPAPGPPAAGNGRRAVPRLALFGRGAAAAAAAVNGALPGASPAKELPQGAAGGAFGDCMGTAGGASRSPSGGSSGGSSYRPGYDLEEDFERGYVASGLDSDDGGGSDGGSVGGLIPAARGGGPLSSPCASEGEGGGGGVALANDEWGSSSEDGDGGGSSCTGLRTAAGDGAGVAAGGAVVAAAANALGAFASPSKRPGVVPVLNLAQKLQGPFLTHQQQQQLAPQARAPQGRPAAIRSQEPAADRQPRAAAAAAEGPGALGAADAMGPFPGAGAGDAGQGADSVAGGVDPVLASYRSRRQSHALYRDEPLHELVLRLVAALLLSPDGLIDPLALPKDTTDNELQRHVVVLQEHLSHPDNAQALRRLAAGAPAARPGDSGGARPPAPAGAGGFATGVRRLLKLTAAGLFDAGRFSRERDAQLASGAFGSTVKSMMTHPALPRPMPVVIKHVTINADASHHNVSNFEKVFSEVAALEALAGTPGVVPLLDYGLPPDCSAFQLVFPRYAGSLADWRRAQAGGLEPRRARMYLGVFMQMLDIVSKLHAANVVHYDIKGDNFLTALRDDAAALEEGLAALAVAGGGATGAAAGGPRAGGEEQDAPGGGASWRGRFPPAAVARSGGGSGGGGGAGAGGGLWAWPPRPPEQQQQAGGPRRPSRAGPRCLDGGGAAGGGGGKGGGKGCGADAPFVLVLADFGEAVVYGGGLAPGGGGGGDAAGAAPLAYTARHRGSAAFMSPEMHMLGSGIHSREHAHYDRRRLRGAGKPHDVWSLGCCLYELLTGQALFVEEAEPALRIGAALEADAKRRAEARRDGKLHRQASILRDADRRRLAALVPDGGAAPAAAAAAAAPVQEAPAATTGGGWLFRPKKAPAPCGPAAQQPQQQPQGPVQQQPQQLLAGGLAAALLDLVDSILVLDAVHRPELGEVMRRVQRLIAAIDEQQQQQQQQPQQQQQQRLLSIDSATDSSRRMPQPQHC